MDGLPKEHVELLNEIDTHAANIERLVEKLKARAGEIGGCDVVAFPTTVDGRWVSIGRSELQMGFMALRRAVTRDTGF